MQKAAHFCAWHCRNRKAVWLGLAAGLVGVFLLGQYLGEPTPLPFNRNALVTPDSISPRRLAGLSGAAFWREVEPRLLATLNLDLSDFEFRLLYDPYTADEEVAEIIQVGDHYGWPVTAPGDVSDTLLGREPYDKMPLWYPTTRECEAVVFTAGNRANGAALSGMDNPNFNRKQWALRHRYCLVHLRCKTGPRRRDKRSAHYRQYNRTKIDQSVYDQAGVSFRAPRHPPTFDTRCPSFVDPYFWKFIGFLKLIRSGGPPAKLLFLDDDVFITHQTASLEEWMDSIDFTPFVQPASADAAPHVSIPAAPPASIPAAPPRQLAATPPRQLAAAPRRQLAATQPSTSHRSAPSNPNQSRFIIGTDFVAFRDQPVDFLNVTIPLNTGFMYLDSSESIGGAALAAAVLMTPPVDPKGYRESLLRYWDTDQGVLTWVLEHHFGVSMASVREMSKSKETCDQLLTQRRALVTSHMAQEDGTLEVAVVPQRLTASVMRLPYLEEFGRPDLVWQPGDFMVHLYPGWPNYKALGWKLISEVGHPAVQPARWWSMKT